MNLFKVKQAIRLPPGTLLALSTAQFEPRKHLVTHVGDLHCADAPLEFKAGEIIELDNPPRDLLSKLALLDDDLADLVPESAPEAKPAKPAKPKSGAK